MDASSPKGLRQQLLAQGKRLLYPFKDSTLSKLQATVAEMRDNVSLAIQILLLDSSGTTQTQVSALGKEMSMLAYKSNAIEASVSQTGSDIKLLLQGRVDDIRQQIRNWLDPIDTFSFHKLLQKQRQPGTGKWLLDGVDFTQWKTQSYSFLWVHGIPGSGKSVLCSTVVDSLLEYCRTDQSLGIGYFYFSFGDQKRKHAREDLLRALICQFWARLGQEFAEVELLYNTCKCEDRGPTLDELENLLQSLVSEFSEAYIAIDGLDECPEREDLLDTILQMVEWRLSSLHFIVFSRLEDDIEEFFQQVTTHRIRIEDRIDGDIKLYVQGQLKKDIRLREWPVDVKRDIEANVTEKANGMFLLATRQLELIRRSRRLKDLKESLASLPRRVFEVYERILAAVDENDEKDLQWLLCWLAYSERALTLDEAAEVVAIDCGDEGEFPSVDITLRFRSPREVRRICSSLITTRKTLWPCDKQFNYKTVEVVVFAHATVKEYLVSEDIRNSTVSKFWLSKNLAQELICEACLAYILQFDTETSLNENTFNEWPLAQYAAHYWPLHARIIDPGHWTKQLEIMCIKLLDSPVCLSNSLRIWDASREAYYITASSPATKLTHPTAPIDFAVRLGLCRIVELLLDKNREAPNSEDMLSLLLLVAAENEFDVRALITMLLDRGADVHTRDDMGRTPLHRAASVENFETVRILLERGADINAKAPLGFTALHDAVFKGRLSTIRMLLDLGADIEAADDMGQNAIHWIISFPEHAPAVLEILLRYGANINARDDVGETVLHHAVGQGAKLIRIVELLLQHSADTNLASDDGNTPLHSVCLYQNCPEVIDLLLRHGADINARNNDAETPLHLALRNPNLSAAIVELLLEHGAAVNHKDSGGLTPLHVAARVADPKVGPDIITILLSHGADIDAEDEQSTTPLEMAFLRGCEANASLLLDKGARPTSEELVERYRRCNFSTLLREAEVEVEREKRMADGEARSDESKRNHDEFVDLQRELDDITRTLRHEGASRRTDDRMSALLPKITKFTDEALAMAGLNR
ncbi:hypothetical protein VTN00DRAFT_2898 [Thermoascus crustaceus]|uniref:uncharacterized protein n=1 Tax=Thermoascus crustaceus TaxID=5088 RepID=UPI003742629B